MRNSVPTAPVRQTWRAILLAVASSAAASAAPPGWDLIWSDEFTGTTLDASKWTPEVTTNPANNERQAYLAEQVTVSGGNMVITSTNVPFGNKQYRSGRVHSTWARQFGRWEVRADLPTSRGMWPAIWLLPNTSQYPWPSQGEIDILENRGHQPNLTSSAFHYGTSSPYFHDYDFGEQTTARFGQPVDFHSGFHVYAVEWDSAKVRFFVDDVNYLTLYDADVGGYLSRNTAPMRTMLNTAVGGDFLGAFQPNSSTVWPQQFLIDYVRVYERNDDPLRLRNGGFERAGGSLGDWTTFGNKLNTNNVSVHNEAVKDGSASLKIYGQFIGQTNYSGVSQGISVAPGDEVIADAESFIRMQDSLAGTSNNVQMKIEFYNQFGGKYGTSAMLDEIVTTIANNATAVDVWRPHHLAVTAPAGAVEARLAFVFTQSAANGGGAIHIDNVSFRNSNVPDVADADADGDVDGADFLVWQRNVGSDDANGPAEGDFNFDGSVDQRDLEVWNGQTQPPPQGNGAAIDAPEPSAAVLSLTTLVGLLRLRAAQRSFDALSTSAA